MVKGCLYFILVCIAVGLVITVGITVLPFVALLLFIVELITYIKTRNLEPSKMKCPNCNSDDVKISSLQTGSQTQTNFSGGSSSVGFNFFGYRTIGSLGGSSSSNTSFTFKREGICQKCGFNFDYLTVEDVKSIKSHSKISLLGMSIFLVLASILSIYFWTSKSDSNINSENGSIWATEYTSIENFDYYLEGNNIYLKDYKGNDKRVKINNVYEIGGSQYNVVSFSEGVFALSSVDSVILPNGLVSMPDNTFNSCGIKYVYIPASLQSNGTGYSFYNYFHDVETIYYGGTEEQWAALTNNEERSKIDAKEIKYNINSEDLR